MGKRVLIRDQVIKIRKLIAIIAIEPFLGSDPDEPLPILNKGRDAILRQPVFGGEMIKNDGSLVYQGFYGQSRDRDQNHRNQRTATKKQAPVNPPRSTGVMHQSRDARRKSAQEAQ